MKAKKIVLTGGPSGGKTTLAMTLQREFSQHVMVVPEAASLLFGGGFPRLPSLKALEHRQRAIYFVQRELEELYVDEYRSTLLVCDRGSLDGMAYWHRDSGDFLTSVGSNLATEIGRYDWVIHLDTAPAQFYDLGNVLRTEPYDEAWRLNEKIKSVWSAHPQRLIINNQGHFVDKLHRAMLVIDLIMNGAGYQEISAKLDAIQDTGT